MTSVLDQENVTTEIILVDDGSTDKSLEICKKYANNYSNIKVIHTENHGVSHARNVGLDTLYILDSNLVVINYCLSLNNYNAALFRFGTGTRMLLELRKALRTPEAKAKTYAMYKKYCEISKKIEPKVNIKNKLLFMFFRTNLDLYDFVRKIS